MTKFEELIRNLIGPFDGQVLRPWMTDLKYPVTANVFVVGINQATAYPAIVSRNAPTKWYMESNVPAAKPKR